VDDCKDRFLRIIATILTIVLLLGLTMVASTVLLDGEHPLLVAFDIALLFGFNTFVMFACFDCPLPWEE
jgi:hypothetical protein